MEGDGARNENENDADDKLIGIYKRLAACVLAGQYSAFLEFIDKVLQGMR